MKLGLGELGWNFPDSREAVYVCKTSILNNINEVLFTVNTGHATVCVGGGGGGDRLPQSHL